MKDEVQVHHPSPHYESNVMKSLYQVEYILVSKNITFFGPKTIGSQTGLFEIHFFLSEFNQSQDDLIAIAIHWTGRGMQEWDPVQPYYSSYKAGKERGMYGGIALKGKE